MQDRSYGRLLLLIASAVVLYFSFRIFQPFLLPISLAAILANLTYPIFDWTSKRLKGKSGLAAFLTVLWVVLQQSTMATEPHPMFAKRNT